MIYLDHAANTPADPAVVQAYCEAAQQYWGNPNSPHGAGAAAHQRLQEATNAVAAAVGAAPEEVIFTSGATEANNLAIKGVAEKYGKYGNHIITTALEHASVGGALAWLQTQGYDVETVDLLENGQVDTAHLRSLLREDTILVSVCAVDSEIGTCQPIEAIAALLAGRPHCFLHVDATQAIGKVPVPVSGVHLMSFSGHKFHGLNGGGVLLKKQDVLLAPQMHGGISTTAFRSGTPDLPQAVAMEEALRRAMSAREDHFAQVARQNEMLRAGLARHAAVRINSPQDASPYILNISLPGLRTETIQQQLAERNIYVATKSACCAPNTASRPVYALTRDRRAALSTLRISLGFTTRDEEIAAFLECFADLMKPSKG